MTWGGVVALLERALHDEWRDRRVKPVKRLPADAREPLLSAIAAEEAHWNAVLAKGASNVRASIEDRLADHRAQRELLLRAGDPFDPEALAAFIEESEADYSDWRRQQPAVIAAVLAEAKRHDPLHAISTEDQQRLGALFREERVVWHMGSIGRENPLDCLSRTVLSLERLLSNHRPAAVATAIRDLYRAGATQRASLPEDMRLAVEADLRRIEDNRPHRLGGTFQPVQDSGAPDDKLLLLQLGTDDPTGFQWSDSGALFAWIDIAALRRGNFNDIEWWTENT